MNAVIIGFLLLINCFAILLNIKMTSGIDTSKKITMIVIEEIVLFVIMNVIYTLCSANIEIKNPSNSRMFQVLTFTGINMMIMAAPINKIIAKHERHEIKGEEGGSKIRFKIIMAIVILAIEYLYIKSIIKI